MNFFVTGDDEKNENNRIIYSASPNSDDYQEDDSALKDLGVNVTIEEDVRPFRLSDLATDYSTDSGPQSEPESDDSRPASRLGSSNSRIVYLDRSGGATSEDVAGTNDDFVADTPEMIHDGDLESSKEEKTSEPDLAERDEKQENKERTINSDDCLLSRR